MIGSKRSLRVSASTSSKLDFGTDGIQFTSCVVTAFVGRDWIARWFDEREIPWLPMFEAVTWLVRRHDGQVDQEPLPACAGLRRFAAFLLQFPAILFGVSGSIEVFVVNQLFFVVLSIGRFAGVTS